MGSLGVLSQRVYPNADFAFFHKSELELIEFPDKEDSNEVL